MLRLASIAGLVITFLLQTHGAELYPEDILKLGLLQTYAKSSPPKGVIVQHQLSVWQIQVRGICLLHSSFSSG